MLLKPKYSRTLFPTAKTYDGIPSSEADINLGHINLALGTRFQFSGITVAYQVRDGEIRKSAISRADARTHVSPTGEFQKLLRRGYCLIS